MSHVVKHWVSPVEGCDLLVLLCCERVTELLGRTVVISTHTCINWGVLHLTCRRLFLCISPGRSALFFPWCCTCLASWFIILSLILNSSCPCSSLDCPLFVNLNRNMNCDSSIHLEVCSSCEIIHQSPAFILL